MVAAFTPESVAGFDRNTQPGILYLVLQGG